MEDSQTNLAWDVFLDLGSTEAGPLHERIRHALLHAIRSGRIEVGTALPPSRVLAADLGCSRWAVTEAYGQLVAEGYLEARTGSATRVRWNGTPGDDRRQAAWEAPSRPRYDLAPGLPDLRAFPRRRWADAVSAQVSAMSFAEFGFPEADGHPRLREAIARYVRRARGATATADQVVVTTSVTEAVRGLCAAMRASGIASVAVEEPGWTRLRDAIRGTGMDVVPVGTDTEGLCVDELAARHGVRAVVATPAHQFPGGTVLAPDRRAALLEWAHRVDGVILEDDYDAEFRYDRKPVASMQGMEPSRVVLMKSLSKTLAPALGIGWLTAPPRWLELLRAQASSARLPPTVDQLAFAAMLESGDYDRHLRACRLRYRRRRDSLVDALAELLPEHEVSGIAAGLHLVLHLPATFDTSAIVRAAASRLVSVADLATYHATDRPEANGLVLGYGNLADNAVHEAVERLSAAIRGLPGRASS